MTTDFTALRAQITAGAVLAPSDAGYEESLIRWSYAAIKPAAVVVQVANTAEVSAALQFAKSQGMALVVMGGGHSTSGASSIDGGMVIDLRRMNQVSVDVEGRTATYGGGCKWKDVDEACGQHKLATVGGTVNHTGVGGLTLGGGYGWLTSRHGLTIDNLLAAEVVLADGSVVTASEKENADLFWALRGAGQNFGVVTSFTSQLHPQGDVWAGPIVFSLDKIPELVAFANHFHEHNTGDESFFLGLVGGMPGVPVPSLFTLVFYNGTREKAEAFFKPLLDAGPLANMATEMPYAGSNGLIPNRDEHKRRLQGGTNFVMPMDESLLRELADDLIPFVQERGIGEGSGVMLEMFPNKKVQEVGNTDTAFAARGPFYHAATVFTWEDEALDGEVREFNRKVLKTFRDKGFKGGRVAQYNNYDGEHIEPDSAFGDNLARLREIKTKFDPENVFCKWHSLWPLEKGN